MADQRITELTALSQAGIAANDVLPIADISGSETKKVTVSALIAGGIAVSTGSIDLGKLNQASVTKLGTLSLADDSVTYGKLQNVSAGDRVLGRITSAGAVEEIVCTAAGRAVIGGADAAAQRTSLGLGTTDTLTFSSVTADLVANTAVISTATISGGTITGITDLTVADGGTGASDATNARVNLGVRIGADVQAFDAGLQSISSLTTSANQGIYLTAADTYAVYNFTQAGRDLLDDADAAAQRTTLGLGTLATQSGTFSGTSSGTNTGDQTITLTGDVTGTGTGSFAATISDSAVGTDQVANNSITFAKLNLSAGDVSGTLITDSTITAAKLAPVTITTDKIADDQITYSKIQNVSVTDRLLGRVSAGAGDVEEITCTAAGRAVIGAADAADQRTALGLGALATLSEIDGTYITDLSVNTADLAENSVTLAKLNLNAQELAGTLITNGTINTDQLAADAVTTAKVEDNAITYGKLQNTTTQNIILGRVSAGAGDIEEITCTAVGRALIDDVTVADQRTTLGLGTLATQDGTFSGTHSGTSSGTNTGDQTITLTGPVTGTGTGTFATSITADSIGTTELISDSVTYDILQDTAGGDVLLGRSLSTGGQIGEIACTSAGRDLLADPDVASQRETLGLGNLALADGTWTNGSSFSGTSSGTNTGDQTITLTGAVTGSGTGSFLTTLSADTVGASNIQTDAVTASKINDSAVTEEKLGDESTCIVSAATPSGTGAFTGQAWFNTSTSVAYRWNGAAWVQEAGIQEVTVTDSTPLSVVVNNPDDFTANITLSLDTQGANTVFIGPASGADAAPTFRALVAADLPDATASAKGAIQPGTGLSVSGGTLDHSNSVTAATKSGITFDSEGHITAAVDLIESDIPDLDAAKIATGTLGADRLAGSSVTADKLADKSTSSIGETLPVADFIGQLHFNPLDKNFFLWDGNVWQSIGISAGAIILAGTYDASTNQIASVTGEGSAIGLTVGNALPSPSNNNSNYYLVVSEPGNGTTPAPTVALAPPDLLLSTGTDWLEIDVSSTYTAQTANNVAFTPAASLGSTTVQAALEEVSNECRNVENVTTGVLDVDHGGTNIASYTKGDLIAASGTTTLNNLAVGQNGYILSANSSETTGLEWIENKVGTVTQVSVTAPLGVTNATTTPALTVSTGTTSAVGVLQLTDGVTSSSTTTAATPNGVKTAYDLANAAIPKSGGTFTGEVHIGNTGSLVFEGPTDDNFEITLAPADPTADHTITLPNADGTLALTSQLDDGTF